MSSYCQIMPLNSASWQSTSTTSWGAIRFGGVVMKQILVLGAGHIGSAIARMLAATGDYAVTLADRDPGRLFRAPGVTPLALDGADAAALHKAMRGKFAVLFAGPFYLAAETAEAAKAAQVHYLDLTEDVAAAHRIKLLAEGAPTAFIPMCGLAPGFISIVAADLARRFDELYDLRLRTGALPAYPSNALGYNLTWSTDGLINEYCAPCEVIADGVPRLVPALEACETFAIDGAAYEAFNTSGGLGTLCDSFAGKVRNLNYKTIRYPGHAAIMRMLLSDLHLSDRRDLLKEILEHALPATLQDVVIVFVTATGLRDGRLVQETYANRIHGEEADGLRLSAIQRTTASSICAVLDLLAQGRLPSRGFVRQEEIELAAFLKNRFGRVFAQPRARAPAVRPRPPRLEAVA
jgi:saccharopine dehydrogenase-like NADP-dependent oxidoreductase